MFQSDRHDPRDLHPRDAFCAPKSICTPRIFHLYPLSALDPQTWPISSACHLSALRVFDPICSLVLVILRRFMRRIYSPGVDISYPISYPISPNMAP
eukprot:3780380-Pyramimonas_sp.AAC.1